MARIDNSWLYSVLQNEVCPHKKTTQANAHCLVWPKDTKKLTRLWNSVQFAADTAWFDQRTQKSLKRVSCLRSPCQRIGLVLGLGTNWAVGSPRARPPSNHCQPAISSIQPYYPPMDPAITGGHPGYLRKRIKGSWMDRVRRSNAEWGLLKGKPGVDVRSRENDINCSF